MPVKKILLRCPTNALNKVFVKQEKSSVIFEEAIFLSSPEFYEEYKKRGVDLVVIGGKEYGTGSSRDWAAKGTKLLGVKAVIAESFERIHRSNLIGMGVLPLQFTEGNNRTNLNLIGSELITVLEIQDGVNPSDHISVEIKYANGDIKKIKTLCRIDTKNELEYYKHGGILQFVLRNMI